jgi:hypothetical protein
MTPKEKAVQLCSKFNSLVSTWKCYNDVPCYNDIPISHVEIFEYKRQCALIVVEEILNNDGFTKFDIYLTEYWEEVKKELSNL